MTGIGSVAETFGEPGAGGDGNFDKSKEPQKFKTPYGKFDSKKDPARIKDAQKAASFDQGGVFTEDDLRQQLEQAEKEADLEKILKSEFKDQLKQIPDQYKEISFNIQGTPYDFKYNNITVDKSPLKEKKFEEVGEGVKEGKINLDQIEVSFLVESKDPQTGKKNGDEQLAIPVKKLLLAGTLEDKQNVLKEAIEGQHGGSEIDKKRFIADSQKPEPAPAVISKDPGSTLLAIEKISAPNGEKPTILKRENSISVSFTPEKSFELTQQEAGIWKVEIKGKENEKENKFELTPVPTEVIERELNSKE